MCPRCAADPQPAGFGDPRQCAFDAEGNFTPENWNCATIDALLGNRPTEVHGSDERCEITPTWLDDGSEEYGGFIVTTRHKKRGRTSSAVWVGDFHPYQPLTLAFAERVIASRASHEVWRQQYGMPEPQNELLEAARGVIAQFEAIKRRQYELLVLGQTLESAAANWDEATLGQFIDFDPLIAAIADAEGR